MIGGELDGRYRILSKVGEGAMGEVYLVEHLALGRKEALKVLRSSMDTPSLVTRFRREARATNRLQHPNIVAIHDFGRLPDGRFYIATEYAEGDSLDRVIARIGVFPLARAVPILIQLADAIDHAHSRGVIHRDLKPANLMLYERRGGDHLKVLDFGVAKIIAPDDVDSILATGQGEIFGTPAYMAPEQVVAKASDPRIDIYAFGCIAYELVTGDPPFIGRPLEVMSNHMWAPPRPPSEARPSAEIPGRLDEIILTCLEKAPTSRFQTGADLGAALAEVRAALAPAAVQSLRRRPRESFGPTDMTSPDAGGRWIGGAFDEPTALGDFPAEGETSRATTDHLSPGDIRMVIDHLVLQLAEAIIDLGCSDFQLAILAAEIAGTRGHVDGLATSMDELERARDAVARRARDSEARFRFAVSELRFELEQARAHGAANRDMEFQLEQLEDRMGELASHSEREVAEIDDRAIALAAERATREEELARQFASLGTMVDEAIPRFRGHPIIEEILTRLERMRQHALD